MSEEPKPLLSLGELVKLGLEQGIKQVEAAGSPLHPLLFDETGRMMLLFDDVGGRDPMELACVTIKKHAPNVLRCALVVDTRVALDDGKKWDAITVMACERGTDEGTVWTQRYVPKRLFRKFRTEGEAEQVGKSRDFISAALSDA